MRPRLAMSALAALWAGVLPGVAQTAAHGKGPRSLGDCDLLVRKRPAALGSYRCYWLVGKAFRQLPEAASRLRAILKRAPDNHRARLYLGAVEATRGLHRAEELLSVASEGLHRQGDHRGEVYGRTTLAFELGARGVFPRAKEELDRAQRAAEASGDRALRGMVHVWRGYLGIAEDDYGAALRWFEKAEVVLFPDGPRWLRQRLLRGLGDLYASTGQDREAAQVARREIALLREEGDPYLEAFARLRLANQAAALVESGELDQATWRRMADEALGLAQRTGNHTAEGYTRLWLFAGRERDPARALAHLRRVDELTRDMDEFFERPSLLRMMAKAIFHRWPTRAAQAFRLVRDALAWSRARGDRWNVARILVDRAYLRWHTGPRAEAIRDSLEALDAIDRLRGRQPDQVIRAQLGSVWAFAYHLVAGHLLAGAPQAKDLQVAFQVIERLRARTLLEAFDAARRHRSGDLRSAVERRRQRVLQRITRLQRRLLRPTLEAGERASALASLGRLETQADALRDEIARADPGLAAVLAAGVPSMREVQQGLPHGTALLLFQVQPRVREVRLLEGTGAWVLALTRDKAFAAPLAGLGFLAKATAMLRGALLRRDGSEAPGAARLYREVLGGVIGRFSPGIRRLVLVPDGPLLQLPFAVLRPAPDAAPIATRFAISLAPSAALWLRWKRTRLRLPPDVLAYADPALPTGEDAAQLREAASWLEGQRLGRLPEADAEVRSALAAFGGRGRILAGAEATERSLKQADLSRFGVVHIAAHAVVDEDKPDRSAVVLAPGAQGEDGLLQVREITALDFRGRVVVLPACRSASGAVLAGDGMRSLARAFLQAGARAVVGSMWPLRDEEARILVSAFYRHLGEGRNVASALAAARAEGIRSGAPAAAWASLVVVGDGDVVPLPRGGSRSGTGAWLAMALGAVALLSALAAVRARGRGPTPTQGP